MTFITKINLSENLLFKQMINKWSKFVGYNEFSVPMSERRLGADIDNAKKSVIARDIYTPFKYFNDTDQIEFDFQYREMYESSENIPDINFDDELFNIDVPPVFIGENPYVIDGVTFYDNYRGFEYDLVLDTVKDTEFGFEGIFRTTELILVETPSLDYKGDNVVVKVNGILTADKIHQKQTKTIDMFESVKNIDSELLNDTIIIGDGSVIFDNNNIPIGAFYEFIFTKNSTIQINDGEIINPKEQYFGNIKLIKVNIREFLVY